MSTAAAAHADGLTITQVGPNGIVLDNTGGPSSDPPYGQTTAQQWLSNLWILNCSGYAVIATGESNPDQDLRASMIRISNCVLGGFYVDTPDYHVSDITIHGVGDTLVGNGFELYATGQVLGCKSALVEGQGFRVGPPSGLDAGRIMFTGCTSEDNKGSGFYFDNTSKCVLTACQANDNGVAAGTRQAGFDISANASYISFDGCLAQNRDTGAARKQAYGLRIASGATDIHWNGGILRNNYGSTGEAQDGSVSDAGTRTIIKNPTVTEIATTGGVEQYKSGFLSLTAAYTIKDSDNGMTFVIGAGDVVVTLPALTSTKPGLTYTFILAAAALAGSTGFKITPAAADSINGNGLTSVASESLLCAVAGDREGDMVTLASDSTTNWYITSINGTWTKVA